MSPGGPVTTSGGVSGGRKVSSGERRESVASVSSISSPYYTSHGDCTSVEDQFSPLQKLRRKWQPTLPGSLGGPIETAVVSSMRASNKESNTSCPPADMSELASLFPYLWELPYVNLIPSSTLNDFVTHNPLRVGIVLSGGQAPGGHNVIAGVYDYIKRCSPSSQLFGFRNGPHGIFTHNYVEIHDEFMHRFRNQGGFDMICSGRHKIETDQQKKQTLEICCKLDLHGLIIVGGDDSNTNAAILAEYFQEKKAKTNVIGCPKTIDGDLRNKYVEASFGFDTAVKTYAEFIGNLCTDVATSGKYYHFVRLMGRSASHITLECAMQTRPNLTFVGEEIEQEKKTLKQIVDEIVDLIMKRREMNRNFGVILLPEGLIEFIPEMGKLIGEINVVMSQNTLHTAESVAENLSAESRNVFTFLPSVIQSQLLLDRDPHGNVQVAMIATERLLILSAERELKNRLATLNESTTPLNSFFNPQSHYFGYEGRCGMPSLFDSNYCYGLGFVAGALIDSDLTGYMAVLKNLSSPVDSWLPAGCPLTLMMTMETRKAKKVPVIKKFLVELDSPYFQAFKKVREEWKYRDVYCSPGSIQFEGPLANVSNFTVSAPKEADLLPGNCGPGLAYDKMSKLQRLRLKAKVDVSPVLFERDACLVREKKLVCKEGDIVNAINRSFPLQVHRSRNVQYEVGLSPIASLNSMGSLASVDVQHIVQNGCSTPLKIGVVMTGQQSPGVANCLWGICERVSLNNGTVLGFKGADGLIKNDFIEVKNSDLDLIRNQGGFELLGRTADVEPLIAMETNIAAIKETVKKNNLHGLILIGGCWTITDAALLTEVFIEAEIGTKVVSIPATQNNNINSTFIESTIGFDSASKCYSHLIGNLLTDAASARKYWYFIRLMGRDKSQMVLEASLQTHSNVTLVTEVLAAGEQTLRDVVKNIADTICARAESGKNFGALLIPEGLITEIPEMNILIKELTVLLYRSTEDDATKYKIIKRELIDLDDSSNVYSSKLSALSYNLLKSLPQFIREKIVCVRTIGRFQLSSIPSEEMLAYLVKEELSYRREKKLYEASFSPVCFYFGYQARSGMPSQFDCALGLSHGLLSVLAVENNLTGYCTSLRGLCDVSVNWKPILFPITTMVRIPPIHECYAIKVPMVQSEMISLKSKALKKVKQASRMWEREDRFCNPGPIQFWGEPKTYYTRLLFEQQFTYLNMLNEIGDNIQFVHDLCTFGVDETSVNVCHKVLDLLKNILTDQDTIDAKPGYAAAISSFLHNTPPPAKLPRHALPL